jgi:phage baseplate assembly protein W
MAELIEAFHFPVRIDRARGELKQEPNLEPYVAQLIRQVLLTAPGERAHRPEFGAGLRRMVFAPNDDATAALLQTTIFQNLTQHLSQLITVNDVTARANNNVLEVTVIYTLKARGEKQVLNLEVTA